MAAKYYLYTTLYDNTLVDRSDNSFAPLPPDTGEIFIDYFIPNIQPLYYYRESGGTIVLNAEATINNYLIGNASEPTPVDSVPQFQFTGYTASTDTKINNLVQSLSGVSTGTTVDAISFHADATANISLANQVIGIQFLANNNRNIRRIDLSNAIQIRLLARVTTSSTSVNNPRLLLRYFNAFSTNTGDYLDIGASEVNASLSSVGVSTSGWIDIVPAAKGDVYLAMMQIGGDGAADPQTGNIVVEIRKLIKTAESSVSGITEQVFTGYTASTNIRLTGIEDDIVYISGITDTKLNISDFNVYTGTTATILTGLENNKINRSGDTMTGSLRITESLYVTGTSATTQQLQNAVLLGAITSDGRIVATNTPALNVSEAVVDITTSTSITEISGIYYVDTTVGDITLTIPNANSSNDAKKVSIIKKDGTNNVIITTSGGIQNIGNQTTQTISQIDKGLTIVADNDNNKWIVVQDSRYVEGQTEGEFQYWDNTLKVWQPTTNDITWDNTGLTFNVGGNSTPQTFQVNASDDIVYINTSGLTGLSPIDDLGFYAGGRGAFGNSVTIDRLRANVPGLVPRALSLIDTTATLRVWRYVNDSNDPSVEFVWGTGNTPSSLGNAWWDMFLDGAVSPNDSFSVRRRTEGVDTKVFDAYVDRFSIPLTTTSITPTTGALIVAGGVGINENLNIGGVTKLGNVTPDVNQQNFTVIDNTTKKLANSGTKFHVYGSEFQYAESLAESTTTSTTPQIKVTLTTTDLPAGLYKLTGVARGRANTTNSDMRFRLYQGASPLGTTDINIEPKDGTSYYPIVMTHFLNLSGVQTFTFRYSTESGGVTIYISDATLELIRVQ